MWIHLVALVGLGVVGLFTANLAGGQEGYREVAVADGGSIAGEASYTGSPPGPFVVWVKKDAAVFGEKLPDERVLVSRNGRIRNVLVMLEGVKAGKRWPAQQPRLLNKGGLFVPHLQVTRTAAQLEVINQDSVLHNSHAYMDGKTLFNLAQPNKDQVLRRPMRRPGIVELMCDSHDWMNGWIAVLDHPYFAVTGEDGTYAITDVPPGTYTLTAWHEKLGRRQTQVVVRAKEQTKMSLTFPVK